MRHPFDGINTLPCDSAERVATSSTTDRRSVLGRIFVAAAGSSDDTPGTACFGPIESRSPS